MYIISSFQRYRGHSNPSYKSKDDSAAETILANAECGSAIRVRGVSNSATFPSSSTNMREQAITVFNLWIRRRRKKKSY